MAMNALVKPFLSLPLFRGLKPLQLTELVRRADRIIYQPGDVLIEEDVAGDAAIIIVAGDAVEISKYQPDRIGDEIPEGSMLGELAMLVETVHSATVVAHTTVKALKLHRDDVHQAMLDDPSLAAHFSDRVAERLGDIFEELQKVQLDLQRQSDDLGPAAIHRDLLQSPHTSSALH